MLIINEITWVESLSTCSDNLAPSRYRLESDNSLCLINDH